MIELPAAIADAILAHTLQHRSPAYLFVAHDGRLEQWGGDLAHYDLAALQRDQIAREQMTFLEGLLPLQNAPVFLPLVKMQTGRAVDIFLIPDARGDWVLLLDAEAEETERRLLQQKVNDGSLLRERQERRKDNNS